MTAPDRWAAFLAQIAERHAQICAETIDTAHATLLANNYDPAPVSRGLTASVVRLKELERKIIDTWHDKVEATFDAEGFPFARRSAERRKGEDLSFELELARDQAEMRVATNGARTLQARASETGNQSLAQKAVAWGSHALSKEAAHSEWLAMRATERRLREHRSPTPLAILQEHERAQITFWTRYFTERCRYEPVLSDIEREVAARMQFWYDGVASEQEWIRAGKPRLV